jgi:iron(III) transport system substrate-binding protein
LNIWFWNNSQFDECPIKSWWDVLDKKEDGSYVYKLYIAGPSLSAGASVFANLSLYSAELEASYLKKYGTPLEYTYDASVLNVEPNNAAYEFLYRLAQANYTIIKDGNDIVDAVGRSTETCLGFCTANKLNVAQSNNLPVAWVIDLEPYASMHNAKYLYYVTDSDNPAGARLLMYYLMGGKDGNNSAIKTLARVGVWFLRDDTIDPAADVNTPISQIITVPQNMNAIYERMGSVADFWTYWADKFTK